ncbi:type IX secretion system protein PorQ [Rhodocytophaga rosea]|uniref:Type IX secretion system protein PorQ n=1 Tax=Rhodocytophaga rosea TaxID=2704465 RepID=A0A6C0GLI1_9BACT|nr:type IX secretion system protein PorQ [Rhodocytophaga rosea]QHT68500.1 type IX secretion system protein PorQ [Rhodocytophaga rosea]
MQFSSILFHVRRYFLYLTLCLCWVDTAVQAQYLGGRTSFSFVNLPGHAPLAALGGINVSLRNQNVNSFLSNPALLSTQTDKHISLSYVPYYAGINYSTLAYSHPLKKAGRWAAGLQYINYGTFEETDATGAVIGSFKASDYILTTGYSHIIGHYTLGANLKLAGSTIANYSAYAAMLDIGAVFKHPVHDLSIGLVIKNAGFALKAYHPEVSLAMPFDVQAGVSFKPKFMPLRFSFTAHHLHQLDIAYDDPAFNTTIDPNGNKVVEKVGVADKIARHFTVGTQILLGKAFQIQVGYNHLLRQELRLINQAAGSGFSLGASLHIKSFDIAYARGFHHAAGGISYLTLISNLGTVFKKK